jgi:hypothetical protein
MSELLDHSQKSQDLLKILAEMMNSSLEALNHAEIQMSVLNLKQTYLILIFGVVNSYSEAVFELCKQHRPKPAMVLLRSILESWINSAFFLSHNNENRLFALMMYDSFTQLGLVNELDVFSRKYPWLVKNSVISKENISKMRDKVENDLELYRKKGLKFKTKKDLESAPFFEKHLIERAKKADMNQKGSYSGKSNHPFEHQYLMVYRYLSDFTHVSLIGTNNFVVKTEEGYDLIASQSNENVEMQLVTLFVFYLSFINKLKQYKIVTVPNLNKFNRFFSHNLAV